MIEERFSPPTTFEELSNTLDTATASMAKYGYSDLQCKVMNECV
ncbi:MAG: hypothetical protein ABIO88_16300 [Burkholderiaceae bacterium]